MVTTQKPEVVANTPRFKQHLRKIKRLYKKNAFVSFFDDVQFLKRPSILDGTITQPFQLNFSGPNLENIMKKQEKKRREIRELQKIENSMIADETTKNGPLKRTNSDEILDMNITDVNFSGLYVALWMTVAMTVLHIVINTYINNNDFITDWPIVKFMTTDLVTIALADLFFYCLTYFNLGIHLLCKWNWLNWNKIGWKLVSLFEINFIILAIYLPEHVLNLHWIAKIFLFLHSLVLLMKMHSFAFYNGYLWKIVDDLDYTNSILKKWETVNDQSGDENDKELLIKYTKFCHSEIDSQKTLDGKKFPETINCKNFFRFSMFPTLVYQNEYPRTQKIRWNYVTEKVCSIFGTILVMVITAQVFMYPIALEALEIRESEIPLHNKFAKWGGILINIIPSFICMYLLTFYLIWECILNCIAELSYFGDRYFYGDWWNCVDWGEFSRIWNIPVHKFLLRHVYHSSISALNLNKANATFMTFFISSVVHELAMYVIFKRLRFYLFMFQMFQLPLVSLSNSKILKGHTIIGNVFFWIGICAGPSVMCSLYLTI